MRVDFFLEEMIEMVRVLDMELMVYSSNLDK